MTPNSYLPRVRPLPKDSASRKRPAFILAASIAALLAMGGRSLDAQITNASFETGDFTGFSTTGNASIESNSTIFETPTNGTFQALIQTTNASTGAVANPGTPVSTAALDTFLGAGTTLGTNPSNFTNGSAFSQVFNATSGSSLSFDTNFLTNELTNGSGNPDQAFAFLLNGSTVAAMKSLGLPTQATQSASALDPIFNNESGYATTTFSGANFASTGSYKIGFVVLNANNTAIDSGLLVDNLVLTPAPPPLAAAFWDGRTDATWTGANWATTAGDTQTTQIPTANTDVTFSVTTGAKNQGATTLGQNFTIKSLTITDSSPVTINSGAGSFTLTIAGSAGTGINVQNGAGLLTIGANVTLGALSDTITVSNAAGAVINGVLGGTNGLIKAGGGTLILNGANNYSGGTSLNAGALGIGNDSALSSGTVTVAVGGASVFASGAAHTVSNAFTLNGTLTVIDDPNRSQDLSLSGPISGAGGITMSGLGTLNLSGPNNYLGNTSIASGALQLGADQTLPAATSVILNQASGNGGPTFDLNGHKQTIGSLTFYAPSEGNTVDLNGGTLTLNGNITILDNITNPGNAAFSVIQDSTGGGALDLGGKVRTFNIASQNGIQNELQIYTPIQNGGVIINATPSTFNQTEGGAVFSALNTYQGGTTVAQGRLTVTVNGALPAGGDLTLGTANSALTGDVDLQGTFQSVNSLQLAAGNTGGMGNFISSAFQGARLTVDSETADSTYAGLLTGPVTLVKTGPRTFTLLGANTYTGNTGIGGGVLQISNDNNLGDPASSVYLYDNATLRILADVTSNRSLILDPIPNQIIRNKDSILNFAVPISNDFGGGLLDTNGFSLNWTGVISGSGQLTKAGAGILTLTAANTYQGGTLVTGGLINFNSAGNFGSSQITLNGGGLQWAAGVTADVSNLLAPIGAAGGTFDTNGNNVTLASVLTGQGSVTKQGAGTLTLSAANTYAGGTAINGGVVAISNDNNLGASSGPLSFGSGGTLQTLSSITSNRTGVLNAGGGMIDTNGFDSTFSGGFSGPGGLTKTGLGALTLSGASTYTGATTVSAGTLFVDGSIASPSTAVQSGALIGGHGTIGGNLINGGIVSPGNSPGTLTVNGNFTQSPSGTLLIQVAGLAPALHDLLQISGTANLAGTLQLQQLNGFQFHLGDTVTFLTAGSGISGAFGAIINPFATGTMIGAQVVYGRNSVSIVGVQNSFVAMVAAAAAPGVALAPGVAPSPQEIVSHLPSAIRGETQNQFAVAQTLDASLFDSRNAKLIGYLDNESLEKVLRDLDRIAPEELTSIYQIAVSQDKVQSANLQRRLEDVRSGSNGFSAAGFAMNGSSRGYSGPMGDAGVAAEGPDGKSSKMTLAPTQDSRLGVFVTGTGEWVSVGGTDNARGYDLTNAGFTLGLDYKLTDHFVIGLATGYDHSSADLTEGGRVTVDAGKLALYTSYYKGGFYVDSAVQGGYNSYETHRAALKGMANGDTDGGEFSALFGTGYRWKAGALCFGPTGTFDYTYAGLQNFGERGSLAPLAFPNQHQESIRSTFGAKATYDWKIGSMLAKPEVSAGWQHEYGDATFGFDSRLANGAGPEFLVHGPATGRDSLVLSAGFAIQINPRISSYVYYDGELARANYQASSVSGGFRIDF